MVDSASFVEFVAGNAAEGEEHALQLGVGEETHRVWVRDLSRGHQAARLMSPASAHERVDATGSAGALSVCPEADFDRRLSSEGFFAIGMRIR